MTVNNNIKWQFVAVVLGICVCFIDECSGHGILMKPPSRSSVWRFSKFKSFHVPENYDDNALFCGGATRLHKNGGKCGPCGDAYDLPKPRPNEHGGTYGRGVVVAQYKKNQNISITVDLVAAHNGYFEFQICDKIKCTDKCFAKHKLEILSGKPKKGKKKNLKRGATKYEIVGGPAEYKFKARLPQELECGNCVLRWRYVTDNGTGEEYRACSDIKIGNKKPAPPLDGEPTKKPVEEPKVTHKNIKPLGSSNS